MMLQTVLLECCEIDWLFHTSLLRYFRKELVKLKKSLSLLSEWVWTFFVE